MTDSADTTDAKVRRVTFTLALSDIARLRRITARRHPDDPRSLSLTIRELIREEDERGERRERTGK
jgi:hypothetical protein